MTKTYVITGATSGIGEAVLNKLAVEDCIIFAGYRNDKKLAELENVSPKVIPFYVDYAKPETISQAVDFITSKTEHIDTLINIAGCVVAGPVEKLSMEEVRRQFDVNVFGHIELTQKLMKLLYASKIINVSSMASYGVFPYVAPYCASKRCLDMFFNSLLIENKSELKIISIKPGVIATPLWGKSIEENSKYISECDNYIDEMQYVIKNARKNEKEGLSVDKVANLILKVDKLKNPKLSYDIGRDAKIASYFSKLPQKFVNKIVRLGIKLKTQKS